MDERKAIANRESRDSAVWGNLLFGLLFIAMGLMSFDVTTNGAVSGAVAGVGLFAVAQVYQRLVETPPKFLIWAGYLLAVLVIVPVFLSHYIQNPFYPFFEVIFIEGRAMFACAAYFLLESVFYFFRGTDPV